MRPYFSAPLRFQAKEPPMHPMLASTAADPRTPAVLYLGLLVAAVLLLRAASNSIGRARLDLGLLVRAIVGTITTALLVMGALVLVIVAMAVLLAR
jgi:hypothetical protein